MKASDIINAVVALGTWAAILTVVLLHVKDKREQRVREASARANALIVYHAHFLVCLKRIRQYWLECVPDDIIPAFRLVVVSHDAVLKDAPTLFRDSDGVRRFLSLLDEHEHLNSMWDNVVELSDLADDHADGDEEEAAYYDAMVDDVSARLNAMVPEVYAHTYDLLRQLEVEFTALHPNSTSPFSEGAHTEQQRLTS